MADVRHTDILIERLKNHGKDNYRLLRYPGAGHLIEPPYTPYSRTAFHKIVGQSAQNQCLEYINIDSFIYASVQYLIHLHSARVPLP